MDEKELKEQNEKQVALVKEMLEDSGKKNLELVEKIKSMETDSKANKEELGKLRAELEEAKTSKGLFEEDLKNLKGEFEKAKKDSKVEPKKYKEHQEWFRDIMAKSFKSESDMIARLKSGSQLLLVDGCSEEMDKFIKAQKSEVAASNIAAPDHFAMYMNEIGQQAWHGMEIEPTLPSSSVRLPGGRIRFTDQNVVTRAAAKIAASAAYPTTSNITWIGRELEAIKVGDSIDIQEEVLQDYEFAANEIDFLMRTSVNPLVDQYLLDHTPTGGTSQWSGMLQVAGTFDTNFAGTSAGIVQIQNPNIFDVMLGMISQMKAISYGKYNANRVYVNNADYFQMLTTKTTYNEYTAPAWVALGTLVNDSTVAGVRVIPTQRIGVGEILVADVNFSRLYNNLGYEVLVTNSNGTNFTQDVLTMKARRRMLLMIRNVNYDAFMKTANWQTDAAAMNSTP
jgi:HK97 family phage major capsid protein